MEQTTTAVAPTGRVLVLVGRGRYQDQWHDGAAVGQRVAQSAEQLGCRARLRETFPGALDEVGPENTDLIVVSAGNGRRDPDFDGDDAAWVPFHRRLAELVEAGMPLLALHQAASTFADSPTWSAQLGGRWVEKRSMHPPIGDATFRSVDPDHPVTAGLTAVTAYDERYCFLDVDSGSHVLMTTEHEEREHPVGWVAPGPGRVVYDGLGHDVRSYDSPSRRDLLQRELSWLLDARV